jgi:hypothetical protein
MYTRSLFGVAIAAALTLVAAPLPAQETLSAQGSSAHLREAQRAADVKTRREPRSISRDRNVIEFRRTEGAAGTNALRYIEAHRPLWLWGRGAPSGPAVILNGVPVGGVRMLQDINMSTVLKLEWLSGIQAAHRFGGDFGTDAILVTLG